MKKSIIFAAALLSFSAIAAPQADAPKADCEGLRVATGESNKGYSKLYQDITKMCGAKVNLCEVVTKGGLDNLNEMSTKGAEIGFVQIDTWGDMKNGDENIAALQSVMPLNYNYLHVITSVNGFVVQGEKKFGVFAGDKSQVIINKFSDLRGKNVALIGSAQLLGRRLNKQLGYNMQFADVKDDATAFKMVQSGQVAAAFSLSGWPSGTVKVLDQSSGLTMVPFDAPIGEPYKVKPINYKGIAVYNSNALGVQNVLVSRPFTGDRAKSVAALQQCIQKNLSELKEGRYEPAWNEVKASDSVAGMQQLKTK